MAVRKARCTEFEARYTELLVQGPLDGDTFVESEAPALVFLGPGTWDIRNWRK